MALDVFAEASRVNGPDGPAREVALRTYIDGADVERFRELNVIAADLAPAIWQIMEYEPYWATATGSPHRTRPTPVMTIGSDWT
ncbi:hypothetical protein [Streptomyces sp. NPDC050121]|uniref:hypothetical protein n=1 Tax=Streptomyces sp. NPDC050121 TaxID=3365601 RepID=UPI0037A0F9F6